MFVGGVGEASTQACERDRRGFVGEAGHTEHPCGPVDSGCPVGGGGQLLGDDLVVVRQRVDGDAGGAAVVGEDPVGGSGPHDEHQVRQFLAEPHGGGVVDPGAQLGDGDVALGSRLGAFGDFAGEVRFPPLGHVQQERLFGLHAEAQRVGDA